jgi:hypothetical protein
MSSLRALSSLRVHNGDIQGIACQIQTPCKFYNAGPMTSEGLKNSEVLVNPGDFIIYILVLSER